MYVGGQGVRTAAVQSVVFICCISPGVCAQPLDSVKPARSQFYRAVVEEEIGALTYLDRRWAAARDAGDVDEAARWRNALYLFIWNGGEYADVLDVLPPQQQQQYLVHVQQAMAALHGEFNRGITEYRDRGDEATAEYLENEWGAFSRNAQKPGLFDTAPDLYRLEFYTADYGGLTESAANRDFPNVLHFGRHLNRIKIQGNGTPRGNAEAAEDFTDLGKLFLAPLREQWGYLAVGVSAEPHVNAYLLCIADGDDILVQTPLPLKTEVIYRWRIASREGGGVDVSIANEAGAQVHRITVAGPTGLSLGFGATVRTPDARARLAVLFANPPLDGP